MQNCVLYLRRQVQALRTQLEESRYKLRSSTVKEAALVVSTHAMNRRQVDLKQQSIAHSWCISGVHLVEIALVRLTRPVDERYDVFRNFRNAGFMLGCHMVPIVKIAPMLSRTNDERCYISRRTFCRVSMLQQLGVGNINGLQHK